MNVTREVITDLLPLYFGGEASADTRALVDAYFAQDPEFARLARSQPEAALPHVEPAAPAQESEMQALQRTRALLRLRMSVQAVAIFFTLLPFVFTFSDAGGVHWLFLDRLDAVVVIGALAVAAWLAFFIMWVRLRM